MRRICLAVLGLGLALGGTPALAVITGEYLFENNVLDTSGSVRNGTFAVNGAAGGTPTFVAGLYPGSTGALQLNSNGANLPNQSAGESVLLPMNANFIRNAPGATLMAWVRLDGGSSNRTIISVNNGDAGSGGGAGSSRATLQIIDSSGSAQVRALGRKDDSGGSSSATSGSTFLTLGQTYFIAGVFNYSQGYVRAFINGAPVGNANVGGWTTNSADSANLVAELGSVSTPSATNQEYWPGVIDGARIFNTALTDEQIMDLYLDYTAVPNPVVAGDTDGNGFVEAADLTPIRQNYRLSGKLRSEGDLTGDTIVDWLDFRQWKTEYLKTVSGGGSLAGIDLSFLNAGQVPEPGAVTLALTGCFTLYGTRARRRNERV